MELKAQVDELTTEVANLKQQLSGTGEAVVNNYVAHFHETAEYNSFGLFWRKVTYNEVFGRESKVEPQQDEATVLILL